MCSDGKQCYRNIGNEPDEDRGCGISLASLSVPVLKEKRKESNITSDGSLLGDYVR